jgi:GNAT superfamily N-acetyltransferase
MMQRASGSTFLRDYRPDDRKWVIDSNVIHYTTVEGFDADFSAAVSASLEAIEARFEEEISRFLIAEERDTGQPVGCAFLTKDEASVGRVRLVYLASQYRGKGIARDMIERLIEHARTKDCNSVRVSTYDRHEAACHLYRRLGFRERKRAPEFKFGQWMRQIDFEKSLSSRLR